MDVPAAPHGPATRGAAAVAGTAFGTLAALRGRKPLHPRGVLLGAVVRRHGAPRRTGVPWLDDPGEDHGVVRISRSVGLPSPLPDVIGLALRFPGGDGRVHDLLLATCGRGPLTRHLVLPRRDVTGRYGTVLPYATRAGPLLLGAVGDGSGMDADPESVAAATARRPLVLRLLVARPAGPWRSFGSLAVGPPVAAEVDPPVSFDPVLHPLPGARLPEALGHVRAVAYDRARAGRAARPAELVAVPGSATWPSAAPRR